jgi:hypothetical protein
MIDSRFWRPIWLAAFATLAQGRAGALLVSASPFFNSQRERLVALAARHAIPAIYEHREFATAGGLMSYGPSNTDAVRQAGVYTAGFSRAKSPPTCQCCSQPNSSSLST